MAPTLEPPLVLAGVAGLSSGLVLLGQGLAAYRRGVGVRSIATSTVEGLAAGEVRLSGVVEPLATTLVSPFQSVPCVWYHSSEVESRRDDVTVFDEERAVEFMLRDDTGTVRIMPRGARWDVPPVFDESTDRFGDEPAGLRRRTGPSSQVSVETDREAAIADLLTVHPAGNVGQADMDGVSRPGWLRGGGARRYREARLEPGQTITVMGFALPFGELDLHGDASETITDAWADPQVGLDLAEAAGSGSLASSARAAWGNAAIPGFGMGRPVAPPTIDPGATPPEAPDPRQAKRAERLFAVAQETLVVARRPPTELAIYQGAPRDIDERQQGAFYRGLAGAGLATASVVGLAVMINGGL